MQEKTGLEEVAGTSAGQTWEHITPQETAELIATYGGDPNLTEAERRGADMWKRNPLYYPGMTFQSGPEGRTLREIYEATHPVTDQADTLPPG